MDSFHPTASKDHGLRGWVRIPDYCGLRILGELLVQFLLFWLVWTWTEMSSGARTMAVGQTRNRATIILGIRMQPDLGDSTARTLHASGLPMQEWSKNCNLLMWYCLAMPTGGDDVSISPNIAKRWETFYFGCFRVLLIFSFQCFQCHWNCPPPAPISDLLSHQPSPDYGRHAADFGTFRAPHTEKRVMGWAPASNDPSDAVQ